ncbi:flocculation protein FLO11-like [Ischnura elegans]|uniref:flocculation protein FLO11-like n=1 Tax=Ischnura elegans TaxID=197161 RepID=UPI001ED8ABAD|nr:flocculation protein FLO11-like [Ischnura elegans]XP_046404984.1 flocculation protein FLO11-like [Ischnura elegans]
MASEPIEISLVSSPTSSVASLSPHPSLSDLSHISESAPIPSPTPTTQDGTTVADETAPSTSKAADPPSGGVSGSEAETTPEHSGSDEPTSDAAETSSRRSRSRSGSAKRRSRRKKMTIALRSMPVDSSKPWRG